MSADHSSPFRMALALMIAFAAAGKAASQTAEPASTAGRQPADLAGTWEISDTTSSETCRVFLRPQHTATGDYFIGIPPACRHTMPELAKIGHWAMPDPAHLKLTEGAGAIVLVLAAAGDAFSGALGEHVYTLKPLGKTGVSTSGFASVNAPATPGFADIVPISKRSKAAELPQETPRDLGGRYAVMREKRDTGCMITLDDTSRVKGGSRAQLAPGCRDQGIVIFDPAAWQFVKGELVLTARAGHKTHLQKSGIDGWQKDLKDGGKPLGLKKL